MNDGVHSSSDVVLNHDLLGWDVKGNRPDCSSSIQISGVENYLGTALKITDANKPHIHDFCCVHAGNDEEESFKYSKCEQLQNENNTPGPTAPPFLSRPRRNMTEVEFVTPVTHGGRVKFLPAV